jgi:hypothetical protein
MIMNNKIINKPKENPTKIYYTIQVTMIILLKMNQLNFNKIKIKIKNKRSAIFSLLFINYKTIIEETKEKNFKKKKKIRKIFF